MGKMETFSRRRLMQASDATEAALKITKDNLAETKRVIGEMKKDRDAWVEKVVEVQNAVSQMEARLWRFEGMTFRERMRWLLGGTPSARRHLW